jgi:hypothetical protein
LEHVVNNRVGAIPTATTNSRSQVAGAPAHSARFAPARSALFAPDSLEIVRDDFKAIFSQISLKISLCKLFVVICPYVASLTIYTLEQRGRRNLESFFMRILGQFGISSWQF